MKIPAKLYLNKKTNQFIATINRKAIKKDSEILEFLDSNRKKTVFLKFGGKK